MITMAHEKIKRNLARCNHCGTMMESKYTHDFVRCQCGKCFLDGGKEYIRCGGYPTDIELLTEYEKRDPDEDELEAA